MIELSATVGKNLASLAFIYYLSSDTRSDCFDELEKHQMSEIRHEALCEMSQNGLIVPLFNMAGQNLNNEELNTVLRRLKLRIIFDFLAK